MKALATLLASAAIALSAPAAAQSFVVTNATVAAGDGSGAESSYGGTFADESLAPPEELLQPRPPALADPYTV